MNRLIALSIMAALSFGMLGCTYKKEEHVHDKDPVIRERETVVVPAEPAERKTEINIER